MKWSRTLVIFDDGGFASSEDWRAIHASYTRSIQSIDFPEGEGTLTLRKKEKRENGQWDRNGVGFLKTRFFDHLVNEEKWQNEVGFSIGEKQVAPVLKLYPSLEAYQEPITSQFGNFDFVTTAPNGTHVAIEWETGNISSSHRSMNKLAIALGAGEINVGVLILPSRSLYEHLTDRIGNISELSGYLSMWKELGEQTEKGMLIISVVEHDHLTDSPIFPYLPSGQDGRARQGQAKRLRSKKIRKGFVAS